VSDLAAIQRKLAVLMERTVDRGFTENEAVTAAEMIRDIMSEHGLTMADVQAFRAGRGGTKLTFGQYRPEEKIHETVWASEAIGEFFDVRGAEMPTEDGKGTFTVFIGFQEDVTAALTLHHVVRMAADTSFGVFMRGDGDSEIKRGIAETRVRYSFMSGFMHRISIRLRELKGQRKATGTDLIVLKTETIDQALDAVGLEKEKKIEHFKPDAVSYSAGHAEADKVPLTEQVGEAKKLASSKE
jgi:hypothetical protein